ncbi:MAG TPA: acetyl-CoA C-acetyltransferase [Candidatus Limnocylindrales bacterium]|nr:acetyl-CoA C-acetyltransferase [Candidatus Limnocylindrales bacterium]
MTGRSLPNGEVFLVSAARTPIGKFGGAFAETPATRLGAVAIRAAVERSGLPPGTRIDEVFMGQVLQAGVGQAPARQAALGAGLPVSVPATTINRVCGSGLKAIMLAAAAIRAGDAEVVVAGGMENMTRGPYLLPKARFGYRLGDGLVQDATVHDGLWCAIEDCHMGTHAERVALRAGVSREDQDRYALESHRRAVAAIDAGRFVDEIVPVPVVDRAGRETLVDTDENPRRDTSLEALARLQPVFAPPGPEPAGASPGEAGAKSRERGETGGPRPESVGTVTAGNAPGITDGAAATVVASERVVEREGLRPLARIVGYAQAEVEPRWLFLAPVEGVRQLVARTELPLEAFDLIEINEAFAAQVLADGRELGVDWAKVNVNGGAIALGHPIGASGARIVATLLHELRRRGGRYGLATLCLGGGGSVAMAFERV